MDSSKFVEGVGECSSSESGWTSYIVSSIHDDQNNNDDWDGSTERHHRNKKDAEDVDSDDSMASDASSGPSDHGRSFFGKGYGFGHAGKKDEKKFVSKKHDQVDEKKHHHEQRKSAKGTPENRANSAGRSKKT